MQNGILIIPAELLPDLVQIQVREILTGVFFTGLEIPIQVWHMVEKMGRDFNKHDIMQVPSTENQFEEVQMMEEVSEHMGTNYSGDPDSRNLAQPVKDFLFPWEEAGSAKNPIPR